MTEVRELTELITPGPAEALAGLLGVPLPDRGLPLLWHWVYLLDRPPQAILGADGHPARDAIPSPPGPGLRRMFAGGRVSQHGPLRTGAEATRRTWQASSARKQGRSGPLHFVTVRTEISQGGQVVITEEQDLVYREPAATPTPQPRTRDPQPRPPGAEAPDLQPPAGARDCPVEVNPVLLFRFSALTYNAHRIHYDRDYARAEGYPACSCTARCRPCSWPSRPGPSCPRSATTPTAWSRRCSTGRGSSSPPRRTRTRSAFGRATQQAVLPPPASFSPPRPRPSPSDRQPGASLGRPSAAPGIASPRPAHSRTIVCAC